MAEGEFVPPPNEIDLKNKRKDYPSSPLSQFKIDNKNIVLADPDKRLTEVNSRLNKTKVEVIAASLPDIPKWFDDYKVRFFDEKFDALKEIDKLSTLNIKQLNEHLGGSFEDLPYEVMDTLLVDGTDVTEVAEILKAKRVQYLKIHPEMTRGVPGADQGIITFNGRFINKNIWSTATPSEKRSALVGTTCFHYNSGTPGMDDSPDDRF